MDYKSTLKSIARVLACVALAMPFGSCSDSKDDDPGTQGDLITISESAQSITVDCEETFASTTFSTRAKWTATLEDASASSWLTILSAEGAGGASQSLRLDLKPNTTKDARAAVIAIKCLTDVKKVTITQMGSTVDKMSESDVPNFEKYYKPQEFRGMDMFRSDSKWSWFRYKQSKHFFVFWEAGFGSDPNASTLPDWARVDIDDLLEKAEQFYHTNVDVLGMAEVGKGRSNLDKYKMEIYLLYSPEWLATGSGYDNVIGALWVNPSTCKPVGSTIAHEIGHSFQYQVYCDKEANGEASNESAGFRYGWGGTGGCTYWEQCAQWQSMVDYPAEKFWQDFNPWLVNYHRHFCHEWMRYQSYWLQNYWVQLHGIDAFGRIWRESNRPEDPIQTYMRLYCGGDTEKFWDEYYDYASRMVTYDIDDVRQYRNGTWGLSSQYKTALFSTGDLEYQVSYANTPETAGFNIIRLNVPQGGGNIAVDLTALPVGSALAADDPGTYLGGDGGVAKGNVKHYNLNTTNNSEPCFRYGFVAVCGGTPKYSAMAKGSGKATYLVPSDASELYLVVVPTPAKYNTHAWDNDDLNDEQWPYSFVLDGTDLFGNMQIDPNKEPASIELSYDFTCDASHPDYAIGAIDLTATGDIEKIAQAFVMQPSEIAAATQAPVVNTTGTPGEGKVVFGLVQPSGKIGYNYTANAGFYIKADGSVGSWADNDPIFVEYDKDNFVLTYGHKPGCTAAGTKYVVKPCLVYTKGGKQYTVTLTLNLQF